MPDRRPKIAFVIDNLSYGGAQRQLAILTAALRSQVDPIVCCMSQLVQPYGPEIERGGAAVLEFQRRGGFEAARLRALIDALQRERVDLVHGFLDAANVYSYIAARRIHRPAVASLRNQRLRVGGVRRFVLSWVLRHADWVTANSNTGRDFLLGDIGVAPEKVTVVPNCIDPALLVNTVAHDGPERDEQTVETIGFAGRLEPEKRVDALVRAFSSIRRRRQGVRLTLVGAGSQREAIDQLIADMDLTDTVTMVGGVDNAVTYIENFSVLALPSMLEGTPNVVMEAMALGVPVVATPVGDVPELVVDGQTGRFIRDVSPDGIADAIESVLDDASLRATARRVGPQRMRERHSVGVAVDRLMEVYRRLTSDARR